MWDFRCTEYDVKSKIGNIFVNENIREEHCVKIMKLIPVFTSIMKKYKSWWKWI